MSNHDNTRHDLDRIIRLARAAMWLAGAVLILNLIAAGLDVLTLWAQHVVGH